MISIEFSQQLHQQDENLFLITWEINDLLIFKQDYDFSPITSVINRQINQEMSIEEVKNQPIFQAYRKFYWRQLHVDPTKIRPSSEALIRRIIKKKSLPKISPVVDAYNWASALSFIPMGAYDVDQIQPPLQLRFSLNGESFTPIGKKSVKLPVDTLILTDSHNIILSQFPYRDSQLTKITYSTHSILIVACGVASVLKKSVEYALAKTKEFLNWFKLQGILDYKDGGFHYFA
ncbi:B3/B4 domain-containing protein [Candidatus Harpocratesius sp.]